jgi:hypothetical protein
MNNSASSKYDAPRAVRLGDTKTARLECLNGPTGTPDVCRSGFDVQSGNVCATGNQVVN